MSVFNNKTARKLAFDKVFGGVNVSFSRNTEIMREQGRTEIRLGKTARDKANGHVAYQKNRRVWDQKDHAWAKV